MSDVAALIERSRRRSLQRRSRRSLRRRSRDYFWYSQALAEDLDGKQADVVVTPRHEADVIRVAAACARHRVPLTPRGGGTGNYGQAVPLHGGVVLDMSEMTAIEWVRPGVMRIAAGRADASARRAAARPAARSSGCIPRPSAAPPSAASSPAAPAASAR